MPVYFYWGEDDFAIAEAIATLKAKVVDSSWVQFNYEKLPGDREEGIAEGLNQAMTPPFATGDRLVWLADTNIAQSCSEDLLRELTRTLPQIPHNSHLLFSSRKKPDSRGKLGKLLHKYAELKEFDLIPPWQTEALLEKAKAAAAEMGVKLTPQAAQMLANCVGNDSRLLSNELAKLSLYQQDKRRPLEEREIKILVNVSSQNSLKLANAILHGQVASALKLVQELINLNEPPLRIVATLVGQFRTWTLVKLFLEEGEKNDREIASLSEIGNPKRLYFLRQEIKHVSSRQLLSTLPLLMELELSLKKGANPLATLQSKIIEIATTCQWE